MKVEAFKRFDAAHYLKSDEDVALYLEAVNEFDDPAQMVVARENVVRALRFFEKRTTDITKAGKNDYSSLK